MIKPTFGWKNSQERERAIRKRGIATIKAPTKIAHPTTVESSPPTKGMYPKIVVIGEKKRNIPKTIIKKPTTLIILA